MIHHSPGDLGTFLELIEGIRLLGEIHRGWRRALGRVLLRPCAIWKNKKERSSGCMQMTKHSAEYPRAAWSVKSSFRSARVLDQVDEFPIAQNWSYLYLQTFRICYDLSMKITVEISDRDLKDIMRFSGEKKKGPAIAKFVATELMLRRRRELSDEVMSGKVRFEFPHYEANHELDLKSP